MKFLISFFALCLAACSHAQSTEPAQSEPVNWAEMSPKDAPYWDLVSFTGMDDAFQEAYETKQFTWGTGETQKIDILDLRFEDFKKVSGRIQIFKIRDLIVLGYQSCNGISARYETGPAGELVYRTFGSTMLACEYTPMTPSGRQVVLPNQMYADDWFTKIAPQITGYDVSGDGQILTLHNSSNGALAVFSYRGALL